MSPRSFCLYCFLLLTATGFAQSEQVAEPLERTKTSFGLHVMPLSVINFRSRIRVGAMLRRGRMSYLLDVSYGDRKTATTSIYQIDDVLLFRGIRPEIRYHLRATGGEEAFNSVGYFGIEVPVTWMERAMENRLYLDTDGRRYRFDSARKVRQRTTVVVKYGCLLTINQHFYIDVYTGLGVGIRNTTYRDEINKVIDRSSFLVGADNEGRKWVTDMSAGFRIGYSF